MPSKYYQRNYYPNSYHHIFNRGAYKHKIFINQKDYQTFTDILSYYLKFPSGKPLTKITPKTKQDPASSQPCQLIAYCLMPNHFHLLLMQKSESPTISNLLRRLIITYTMYFQHVHQHTGVLFQGKYKSVEVTTENQLFYLSKYIHLNPHKMEGSEPSIYPFSSIKDYINPIDKPDWLHSEEILNAAFPNSPNPGKKYQNFIFDQFDKDQEIISKLILEEDEL